MDTDDLSREAYQAVIIEAEKFNHDLTLRFGLPPIATMKMNPFRNNGI
jgi:hypothetical protein